MEIRVVDWEPFEMRIENEEHKFKNTSKYSKQRRMQRCTHNPETPGHWVSARFVFACARMMALATNTAQAVGA